MNTRLGALGLIAALVFSSSVRAQDEGGGDSGGGGGGGGVKAALGKSYYFTPMLNYIKSADRRGTDDGYGASVSLGRSMTPGLNLEIIGSYGHLPSNASDARVYGIGLGAQVFPFGFAPDLYIPLYLQRGQVESHPGPVPNYSTTLFDIGLGYLIGLGNTGMSLKAEARYRIDAHGRETAGVGNTTNKAFYEGVAGIGLLVPLGGAAAPAAAEPPPAEAPAAEVTPTDSGDADNDGVPDASDQCPGTPAGAIVDEKGCEKDSDGDGVVDRLDKCPDTPAGTAVNEEGCPAAAAAPAGCIPPEPGQPIDLNGCKAGDVVVLKGVNFELDSARLTPNAKTILDGVADALIAKTSLKVEVGGHTSSEGSTKHNQGLSERRAASVMKYLEGRGVAADRLSTKGYGEGSPIADNKTQEGKELNRRVELKVMDDGSSAAAAPVEAAAPAAETAPAEAAPAEAAPAAEGAVAPASLTDGGAPADAAPAEAAPAEAAPADAPPADAAPADAAPADAPPADAAPAETAPAEAAPADAPPAEAAAPEVENATPAQ